MQFGPFLAVKLCVEQQRRINLTTNRAENRGPRVELSEQSGELIELLWRNQVALGNQQDIGEFHLINEELDEIATIVLVETDAPLAEFVLRLVILEKVNSIHERDQGIKTSEVRESFPVFVGEGEGLRHG